MNKAPAPKTTARMPPDVVLWLQQKAKHNVTSMTAEIVRVVRDRAPQERRERKTGMAVD